MTRGLSSFLRGLVRACLGAGALAGSVALSAEPVATAPAERAAPTFVVFAPGRAPVPVVLPDSPAPGERAAAEELVRAIRKMSGQAAPLLADSAAAGLKSGILVGASRHPAAGKSPLPAASDWLARQPGETDPDTIRISVTQAWVQIEAATPEALPYAVAWFLQQHAGARWFFPGPLGETLPTRDAWTVPAGRSVTRQPIYLSREIHLGADPDGDAWAIRNGLLARFEFNHALNGVFTAEDFAANPEWLGAVRGERRMPRGPKDDHWQPDLASPEVARVAGERARRKFLNDPARRSVSLAVNDTVRFDQGPATRALVEPLRWFRGMPDYSPLVFSFMNRAAAALGSAPELDGRYLGCLAYFWGENVPPFPVDPRVVPYVTTDRGQFYDADFKNEDALLLSRWARSGVRALGLWDYAYGDGFLVPRQTLAMHAETLRIAHVHRVRGYFADASPEWGYDAFKLWAIARLLWDPLRPPEELAGEFFPECYGPAGEPMRRFHDLCAQRWSQQGGTASWLKLHQHEDQALLFPAEIAAQLESALAEAERAAEAHEVFAARVGLTRAAWTRTHAFLEFDRARRRLVGLSLETGRDGAAQLQGGAAARDDSGPVAAGAALVAGFAEALAELESRRVAFLAAYSKPRDDVARYARNDPVPRLLAELVWRDGSAARQVLERAGRAGVSVPRWTRLARELEGGRITGARNLARNGEFATAADGPHEPRFLFPNSGELPADWEVRAVATERHVVKLQPTDGRRPRRNLRIEGAWDTQVFQWNAARPGSFYLATTRARAVGSEGSDAGLFLTFLDAQGRVVGEHRVQTLAHTGSPQWTNLVLVDFAPAEAAWVGVGIAASRQAPGDWFDAGVLELREFAAEVAEAKTEKGH